MHSLRFLGLVSRAAPRFRMLQMQKGAVDAI